MRLPIRTLLLGLTLSASAAGPAAAACAQADLAGTWDLYVTQNGFRNRGDGDTDAFVSWLRCTLRIAGNGAIQAGTSCFNAGDRRTTVAGGRLALRASCLASGRIVVRSGPSESTQGNVVQATLTVDKGLLVGVGRGSRDAPFTLQAVKR